MFLMGCSVCYFHATDGVGVGRADFIEFRGDMRVARGLGRMTVAVVVSRGEERDGAPQRHGIEEGGSFAAA